jgi:phosphoribosylamine--glycine ligase
MRDLGAPYVGFLYVGLMIVEGSPYVLEYNCRLGDPEAQAVLPLTDGRLAAAVASAADGRLGELDPAALTVAEGAAACVVVAAPGYPVSPRKGLEIAGLDEAVAEAGGDGDEVVVFHAGTSRNASGRIVTAGGRVLGVTARGAVLGEALSRAYRAVGAIRFEGMQYRRDIGHRALAWLSRSATEVEQV